MLYLIKLFVLFTSTYLTSLNLINLHSVVLKTNYLKDQVALDDIKLILMKALFRLIVDLTNSLK